MDHQMNEQPSIDRALYLAHLLQGGCPHPNQTISAYVPQYEVIRSLADNGFAYTADYFDIPKEMLTARLQRGKNYRGAGTSDEYRRLISLLAFQHIEEDHKLTREKKLHLANEVYQYKSYVGYTLVPTKRASFIPSENPKDAQAFWSTGIRSVDNLISFPMGALCVLFAKPGNGKTSLMLAIGNAAKVQLGCRVVFLSLEMIDSSIHKRIKHLRNYDQDDVLYIGGTLKDIEDDLQENDLVFVDYPALLPYGDGVDKRDRITSIYSTLRRLSLRCKGVITASQVRKQDDILTIDSSIDSSAPGQFADIVLGLYKSPSPKISVIKNRFGPSDMVRSIDFNYETLEITDGGVGVLEEDSFGPVDLEELNV